MGTVFGAATMLSSLGMAIGPLAGGWIFDTYGDYAWMFIGSLAVGTWCSGHSDRFSAIAEPPIADGVNSTLRRFTKRSAGDDCLCV